MEAIEAMKPAVVIPLHMQPGEQYGSSYLLETKRYIVLWKTVMTRLARRREDNEAA